MEGDKSSLFYSVSDELPADENSGDAPTLGTNPSNLYSFVPSGWGDASAPPRDNNIVVLHDSATSDDFEPDDGGHAAEFTNPSEPQMGDSQDYEDSDKGKEAAGWILPEKNEPATSEQAASPATRKVLFY